MLPRDRLLIAWLFVPIILDAVNVLPYNVRSGLNVGEFQRPQGYEAIILQRRQRLVQYGITLDVSRKK